VKFRPFNEAIQFVQTLGIKNQDGWKEYCRSGKKPEDIPSNPDKTYEKDWKGIGDWLGTGTIAPQDRIYKSFDEAKKFVHSLGLKSLAEWGKYCKSGKKPL
jgi:Integrase repeat unit